MNRHRGIRAENRRAVLCRLGWITRQLRTTGELPNRFRLAAEWECSYKTIDRDIQMLPDRFDYPIAYDRKQCKWVAAGPLPEPVL